MGIISDYLKYRRLKKHYKKLYDWQLSLIEAGLPPIPPDFTPIPKGKAMTPNEAADLLRATTPAPWDVKSRGFGHIDSIGPIEADSGLVVNRWDAELAAAAPELAQELVELGEVNARLKDAIYSMLERLNENERILTIFAEESAEYLPEDFGIQEGDMD